MLLKPVIKIALLPLLLVCVKALAAQPANSAVEPAPETLEPLLATLSQRLDIADLVALTKWDSAKPIQDSDREAQVIANALQQARQYGVSEDEVGQLLAAQIEANKLVQYGLLAAWQTAGQAPATKRPDLKDEIRPRLDELQTRLLAQYAAFSPFRSHPACSAWLNQARPHLARDPLHALALVRATGELCTGTQPRA
ncbi:chorismate mutase [Xanthomonas sp. WHRI 1810A]|uniref:chorismate mutase n=1 Tax=Xanthomonas sp. WHRI 1810A TaxID=3161565 RepID=UPI0032E852C4